MHYAGVTTVLAASLWLLSSCSGPHNFTDPSGPRYAGCCVPAPAERETLRIVTFNIKLSHLRGLALCDPAAAGVVDDNYGASDHSPVWALVELPLRPSP